MVPTEKENEYSEGKDKNTAALENIFIGITCLVIILLGVLIYVTTKTRSRNRFKLLDNSGRELRLSINNQGGRKEIDQQQQEEEEEDSTGQQYIMLICCR